MLHRLPILKLFVAVLAASTFVAPAGAQVQSVSFQTVDPFDANGAQVTARRFDVPARLGLPPGKGPFPAVVIANSSAGDEDQIQDRLLRELPEQGFAVLAIQSFLARGVKGGVGTNQHQVSFEGPSADTLHALTYLRSRPEIGPKRICVMGHSRGGQASFNFVYFTAFLKLAGFEGEPFACNISINSGGHYQPPSPQTTGKPALVFFGDRDDVWHQDVFRAFVTSVKDAGSPVEMYTIQGSYHSLAKRSQWCAQAMTGKGCREPVIYSAEGPVFRGKVTTRPEVGKLCVQRGYFCGYSEMEAFPEMVEVSVDFLRKVLGKP